MSTKKEHYHIFLSPPLPTHLPILLLFSAPIISTNQGKERKASGRTPTHARREREKGVGQKRVLGGPYSELSEIKMGKKRERRKVGEEGFFGWDGGDEWTRAIFSLPSLHCVLSSFSLCIWLRVFVVFADWGRRKSEGGDYPRHHLSRPEMKRGMRASVGVGLLQ